MRFWPEILIIRATEFQRDQMINFCKTREEPYSTIREHP